MKKLISLAFCLLLLLTLAAPAFATETEGSGETESAGESETTHTHVWDAGTVTEATCTTDGIKTYTCTCGSTATETIKATGHDFSAWTQTEGSHERSCGKCGEKESGEHAISTQVTTPATCVAPGEETHTCSVCGYSYTTAIPVSTTHTYGSWTHTSDTHTRSCTVCGVENTGGHDMSPTVTKEPTCQETGVKTHACSICDYSFTEELAKLTTHTYDNACDPECNVCKATREIQHKFDSGWKRDWKEHWHVCSICKIKTDVGDHFPGPAATEERDQLCLTCGMLMTPRLNHEHKYASTWTSDETGHWYACEGCEDQKEFAYHEYDDLCDPDCNICGFASPTAHSFDETWSSDETGHWTVCVLCGEVKETEAHTADPNAAETDAKLCTVCGFEMAPAQEHVHEAAGDWLSDGEQHWKTCECGEVMDSAAHGWDEGTENEDTTITYVCTACGAEKTEGEPKEPSSFPAGLVFIALVVAAVGLVVALILLLRTKKQAGMFIKK